MNNPKQLDAQRYRCDGPPIRPLWGGICACGVEFEYRCKEEEIESAICPACFRKKIEKRKRLGTLRVNCFECGRLVLWVSARAMVSRGHRDGWLCERCASPGDGEAAAEGAE